MEIRRISGEETLELRQKILKPFLSIKECLLVEDQLETTFHHGLFLNNQLVVIATMIQESHPSFSAKKPYRLRGMATDFTFQGKGFGRQLLTAAEENLKTNGCDLLWFNAREVAFPFYLKLEFQFYGPPFELPSIGLHKVMYKQLFPR